MNFRRLTPRRVARYLLRRMHALLGGASGRREAQIEFIGLRTDIGILNSEHQMFVHRQILGLQGVVEDLSTQVNSLLLSRNEILQAAIEGLPGLHRFLNSHDGYFAQSGLWINHPVHFQIDLEGPKLSNTNERIGELPFIFGALAGLPVGSRILDIGSCESLLPLHLASMGHQVVAVDERRYPFEHSNLEVIQSSILDLEPTAHFDAVVLLSTVEHLGMGAYDLESAEDLDLHVMKKIKSLMKDGGLLVLTTPFGQSRVTELERTYSKSGLQRLLDGYTLRAEPVVLVRNSATEWALDPNGFTEEVDLRHRVVMLVATPTAL